MLEVTGYLKLDL